MKKVLNIALKIFTWLMVVIAVCMMVFTIVSVTTFDRSDRDLFGYKAFIVLSDSMAKTDFAAGDLVLVKEVDPSTLREGDIISYISQNSSNYGETVTHKIRSLTTDASGNPGFITYGTTTDTNDETVVTYPFVIGKYQTHIPKLGQFFMFLKTTPGYIVCILIPFLLLILIQGVNCIKLFRNYKREQMAGIEDERKQLQEERAQSQRMMEELLQLKAQLAQQQAGNAAAGTAVEEKSAPMQPADDVSDADRASAPVADSVPANDSAAEDEDEEEDEEQDEDDVFTVRRSRKS